VVDRGVRQIRGRESDMLSRRIGGILVAAVIAVAGVGVAGAGAASAATGDTVLCFAAAPSCAAATQYGANTVFNAANTVNTTLAGAGGLLVTCTASTAVLKNTLTDATPLPGQVTSLTFTGCTSGGGANTCNVTVNGLPWNGFVSRQSTANGNGTLGVSGANVTVSNGGVGNCLPGGLACTFQGSVYGAVTGGAAGATVAFNNEKLTTSGGCGGQTSGTFNGTYLVTGPNPPGGPGVFVEGAA
jgi:hypothetical protein